MNRLLQIWITGLADLRTAGRSITAGIFSTALVAVLLCLAAGARPAQAHPMSQSLVAVSMQNGGWRLRLVIPDDRLAVAMIQARKIPDPGPGFSVYPRIDRQLARAYVLERIRVLASDGRPWAMELLEINPPAAGSGGAVSAAAPADPSQPSTEVVGPNDWLVTLRATPPAGEPGKSARLIYDVVTGDIITHVAIVTLEQDWEHGVVPQSPQLLGQLSGEERAIAITSGTGSSWHSMISMVWLGVQHIAKGSDHIAFLLMILLTVPYTVADRRWHPVDTARPAVRRAVLRISAFTIGHSLALLAASLGWLPAGGRLVEQLIAVSVGLSAVHVLRPIFPSREAWVAGMFGLVHGLAFAEVIAELDLPRTQVVLATLFFNLGIEVVQLAIAAAVLPALIIWRRRESVRLLRKIAAVICLLASFAWLAQRL